MFEKNKLTAKFVEDLEKIIRKELIDKLPEEVKNEDEYRMRGNFGMYEPGYMTGNCGYKYVDGYNQCLKEIKQLIKE